MGGVFNFSVNPKVGLQKALRKIESICKRYDSFAPLDYKIVNEENSKKFNDSEGIGNLAVAFTLFAIFISCLGVFGLASFIAEQRTKEIGLRKFLGASVFSIWRLFSKIFVLLVVISILIATPIAYFLMNR